MLVSHRPHPGQRSRLPSTPRTVAKPPRSRPPWVLLALWLKREMSLACHHALINSRLNRFNVSMGSPVRPYGRAARLPPLPGHCEIPAKSSSILFLFISPPLLSCVLLSRCPTLKHATWRVANLPRTPRCEPQCLSHASLHGPLPNPSTL